MKTDKKLLKKIVNHYVDEDDDLYIKQIQHKIDILQKHKEQIDNQIESIKNSLENYKNKKQKISDEIAKLRLKKQTLNLKNKGIV